MLCSTWTQHFMKQEHWLAAWLEKGFLTSLGFYQKSVKKILMHVVASVQWVWMCCEGPQGLGAWCMCLCKSCKFPTAAECFPALPHSPKGPMYNIANSSWEPSLFAGGFCKCCRFPSASSEVSALLGTHPGWSVQVTALVHGPWKVKCDTGNASSVRDLKG